MLHGEGHPFVKPCRLPPHSSNELGFECRNDRDFSRVAIFQCFLSLQVSRKKRYDREQTSTFLCVPSSLATFTAAAHTAQLVEHSIRPGQLRHSRRLLTCLFFTRVNSSAAPEAVPVCSRTSARCTEHAQRKSPKPSHIDRKMESCLLRLYPRESYTLVRFSLHFIFSTIQERGPAAAVAPICKRALV